MEQFQQINWFEIVVGIVIAINVGIVLYILEYRTGLFIAKKRPYKTQQVFKYQTVLDDKHKQDFEAFYKGRPITNWGNVIFVFGNDGRKEIKIEDFERGEPIRIIFPEETTILSKPKISTFPENLKCEIKLANARTIEVSPLLLNHQEYFSLNIMVENPHEASLDVRIASISKVVDKKEELVLGSFAYFFYLVPVLMVVILGLIEQVIPEKVWEHAWLWAILVGIYSLLLLIFAFASSRTRRKRIRFKFSDYIE